MQITAATIILLELLIVVFLICAFLVFILRKKNRTIVQLSQQLIQKKKALKKAKAAAPTPTNDEAGSAPAAGGKTYPEYLDDAINGTEFHFKNTSGKENIELNPQDHINQQAIALRHLFLLTEKNACIDEGLFSWQAIEEGLSKIGKAYLEVGGAVSTGNGEVSDTPTAPPEATETPTAEADELESLSELTDTSNEIPELNDEITSLESDTLDDDPTTALLNEISTMDEGLEESLETDMAPDLETDLTPEDSISETGTEAETELESESPEPAAQTTPEPTPEQAEPVEEDPMADLLDAFGSISESSADISDVEAEPLSDGNDSIDLATPESEIAELEKALFDTPLDVDLDTASPEPPAPEADASADSELESLMEDTPSIEEVDDELNALEQALADSDELLAEAIPQDEPAPSAEESLGIEPIAETPSETDNEAIANMDTDDIDSILAETANVEASLDDGGEEIATEETTTAEDVTSETTEDLVAENPVADDLPTEFDLSTEELDSSSVIDDSTASEEPAIDAPSIEAPSIETPNNEETSAESAPEESPSLDDIDDIDSLLDEIHEGELPSLEDRVKSEEPDPVLSDDQAELLAELLDDDATDNAAGTAENGEDEKDKPEK